MAGLCGPQAGAVRDEGATVVVSSATLCEACGIDWKPMSPSDLTSALSALAAKGWVEWNPKKATSSGGVEFLADPKKPLKLSPSCKALLLANEKRALENLDKMIGYTLEDVPCRRRYLLSYFGEEQPDGSKCGKCCNRCLQ
jgi:hypothetical protein